MPSLTALANLELNLQFAPIGAVSAGMRLDVPFEGTATSSHWEGERPVVGVDYVTIGADGLQSLDIRGRIGEGPEAIGYRAVGRGNKAGPQELFVFETANEDLAFLNGAVAVGFGTMDGTKLSLSLYLAER